MYILFSDYDVHFDDQNMPEGVTPTPLWAG